MPRGLTTNQLTALTSTTVRLAILCDLTFTSSTVYVWNGVGDLLPDGVNGNTYKGVGSLGKIAPITQTDGVVAQGITIALSGIDPTNLDVPDVLSQMNVKNTAKISLVLLDANGLTIDGPITSYVGFMDQATIDETADHAVVTLSIESRLAQLNRPVGWYLCDSDARYWNPTEGAFQWTSYLQDYTFRFGN